MSIYSRRKFISFSGSGLLLASMPGCVSVSLPAGKRSIPFYRHQPETVAETTNAKALDRLADLFYDMLADGLHPGAQLAVFKDGKPVIHLGGGVLKPGGAAVTERTLFQIRSITKALTATVLLMLHDKGHFTFDDPISHHWPGFEKNGKGEITIGQLMSHRAGLTERAGLRMVDYENRAAIVKAMENLSPVWDPGTDNGYHASNAGWILDELILRWEGRSFAEIIRSDILKPLGIDNLFIGLSESDYPRMARMQVDGNLRQRQPARALFSDYLNRYALIRLQLSWVSGVANAVDLAQFFNILAFEGRYRGQTFFSGKTFQRASSSTTRPGAIDRVLLRHIQWGLGFILGSSPDIYGDPTHPHAIGHPGGGANVAWADPDLHLSAAFLCNAMLPQYTAWGQRYRQIGNAVYACFT